MKYRFSRHRFIFSLIENRFPHDDDGTTNEDWTLSNRAFHALFALVVLLFAILASIRFTFGYDLY